MPKTCPKCHGAKSIKCPSCGGHGQKIGLLSNVECGECHGQGVIRCPMCWGSGKID